MAIMSAVFAGITSVLAKCGIKKTDSDVATGLRTISEIGNQGRYIPNNWVPHMAVAMKMDKEGL